jgi:putative hydrolase of the HAD superfamily
MIKKEDTKALLFDYGGTIDTGGQHWAEVIWQAYRSIGIPVSREDFRKAYVYGERALAMHQMVLPQHNFWHVLHLKAEAELQSLVDEDIIDTADTIRYAMGIADWCYAYAQSAINIARPTLKELADHYPLILVSNFYGNLKAVIEDFRIDCFFQHIVESAVVGVRKPNPEIFSLAVDISGFEAGQTIVIGDSYTKDIVPARSIGCQTVWLKQTGWEPYSGDETADMVITEFAQLNALL